MSEIEDGMRKQDLEWLGEVAAEMAESPREWLEENRDKMPRENPGYDYSGFFEATEKIIEGAEAGDAEYLESFEIVKLRVQHSKRVEEVQKIFVSILAECLRRAMRRAEDPVIISQLLVILTGEAEAFNALSATLDFAYLQGRIDEKNDIC